MPLHLWVGKRIGKDHVRPVGTIEIPDIFSISDPFNRPYGTNKTEGNSFTHP